MLKNLNNNLKINKYIYSIKNLKKIKNYIILNDLKKIFYNKINKYEIIILNNGIQKNFSNDLIIYNILTKKLFKIFYFFKKHTLTQYLLLIDIIIVDKLILNKDLNNCFIEYKLLSIYYNNTLSIISLFNNYTLQYITSILNLYKAAGWFEREIWDLYGIFFKNNYDLKQLLTDYCFNSYPFKKEFPLTGYIELRYDYNKKKINYEPIMLNLNYRFFNFLSGWDWK